MPNMSLQATELNRNITDSQTGLGKEPMQRSDTLEKTDISRCRPDLKIKDQVNAPIF